MDKYGSGLTSKRRRLQMSRSLFEMGISHEPTLRALSEVPRHLFIPSALQNRAYDNVSLPIGYNQTISQPYIVAKMTQLLLEPFDDIASLSVLELGTGSGYQTAVLATCVKHVYSIERVEGLLQTARNLLYDLKLKNVNYCLADGHLGWQELIDNQPPRFDAIIAAAAMEEIPAAFFQQLKVGGRMVLPQKTENGTQTLKIIERNESNFMQKSIENVNFVPFLKGIQR